MSHSHEHPFSNYHRSFAIGVILNLLFVVIEASYGFMNGSLALIADAGHNLSDVLSLLLAWGASVLATKAASETRTYGFRKATIMASLGSVVFLFLTVGGIGWEAIDRLLEPKPVDGMILIIVAGIGVVINSLTALLFISGQKHDLNLKAAFLHMVADTGISLGVVVAGVLMMATGYFWIDPVISLTISILILIGSWELLRDSLNYSLDAVPDSVNLPEVRNYLLQIPSVSDLHDLHIWPLSTTEIALTVHLIVTDECLDNPFLTKIQQQLHDQFGIEHATIQVEKDEEASSCLLNQQCITN